MFIHNKFTVVLQACTVLSVILCERKEHYFALTLKNDMCIRVQSHSVVRFLECGCVYYRLEVVQQLRELKQSLRAGGLSAVAGQTV